MSVRRDLPWLGLATLLALALRLTYATRSGLWRDEALFLGVARLPSAADVLAFLAGHESHPPLYYFLERFWEACFGQTEAAALVLPVLLGVALVPVVYAVGRRVFSREAGLVAAWLVATLPVLAEHSALVRPYALLPLLWTGLAYLLWRGDRRALAGYAILAAAMLYTHNYGWVALAGLTLAALLARPRAWPGLVAANLGAGLLYLPWLPAFLGQLRHAGHAPRPPEDLWHPLILGAKVFTSVLWTGPALAVVAVVLVLTGRAWRAEPGWRLGIVIFGGAPLLSFVGSLAGSYVSELLWPRTLQVMVPGLALVAGAGLAHALKGRSLAWLMPVPLAYVAVALVLLQTPKSNAREVAAAVAQRLQPTDLVVVVPEWLAPGFNFYFHATNRQIDYPVEGAERITPFDDLAARIADPAPLARVRAELARQHAAGGRVWLVLDRTASELPSPPGDGIPPFIDPRQWNAVGSLRAAQLQGALRALYGTPTSQVVTPRQGSGSEEITALLFAPGGRP